MKTSWLSRKFIMAVGGVVTAVLVNVGLPEEVATKITDAVTWMVSAYVAGQGIADAAKNYKADPNS